MPARKPKYGYARDRYGRVQIRGLYDEDRNNEIAQAYREQSRYDYSNFDPEDDNNY